MSLKDEILEAAAEAFDELRDELMPGSRLFLLKRAGQTKRVEPVREVTRNYWVTWDKNREQMEFKLPEDAPELLDQIAETSHIGYGVPDDSNKIYVFSIAPDQRDRIPPTGTSPFWKLYGLREAQLRYEVEA